MKKKFLVQVTVRVMSPPGEFVQDRLEVSEELNITAGNMLELFRILGQFHELTEKIRSTEGKSQD